jgi:hypothetical protein
VTLRGGGMDRSGVAVSNGDGGRSVSTQFRKIRNL